MKTLLWKFFSSHLFTSMINSVHVYEGYIGKKEIKFAINIPIK